MQLEFRLFLKDSAFNILCKLLRNLILINNHNPPLVSNFIHQPIIVSEHHPFNSIHVRTCRSIYIYNHCHFCIASFASRLSKFNQTILVTEHHPLNSIHVRTCRSI